MVRVTMTEGLDLATPAGRAMAGLLALAEFEPKILRKRTRAGLEQARQNSKGLG
jgi:putative DNA-invertase from lambdoid prophage Rac